MLWIFEHSHVEISKGEPIDCISDVSHRPKHDFSVELIGKRREHLTFKRDLHVEKIQVVSNFLVTSENDALSFSVEPWPTGSS